VTVPRVAVDIDGVVADQIPALLAIIKNLYGRTATYDDITRYSLRESLDLPLDADAEVIRVFNEHHLSDAPLVEDALAALHRLDLLCDIVFVTGRANRAGTQSWLADNLIPHADLVFLNQESKVQFCADEGIGVLVEDHGQTALRAAEAGLEAIICDAPWNQSVDHVRLHRCRGWGEVYGCLLRTDTIGPAIEAAGRALARQANHARDRSYCRFSGISVGAVIQSIRGDTVVGVNVENSSYGATICAERSAVSAAVSAGVLGRGELYAIGISAGKVGTSEPVCPFPCGLCRQVLSEFAHPHLAVPVFLWEGGKVATHYLSELLPHPFLLT
jgi:cytidine deaminase